MNNYTENNKEKYKKNNINPTLLNRLERYGHSDMYPFHMPGHKRRLAPKEMGNLYEMDITEIDGFDNLHEPEGILKDAQDFAAKLYHSEETAFVVNGSTAGLLAAIAGICSDGGEILVARNCHKAVYHAIELHHLKPYYIYPPINTKYGINEGIYPQDVEKMWITHQNIQAIVITSPTYDGVVSDVTAICEAAHRHGVPVIVDEAHGAHFNFSEYFPKSAVACGADVVIQSTHKTLPAMTQTALIHLNGTLIDRERVRRMLTIYQTSSPSYILMGSIDGCLHMLSENGEKLYQTYIENLQWLRNAIHAGCRHIQMPEYEDLNPSYSKDYDKSKIVLSVKNTGMTGKTFHEILLNEYHLQMEMVSAEYVLAMTAVGDSRDGYERLLRALIEIDGIIDAAANENANATIAAGEVMGAAANRWQKDAGGRNIRAAERTETPELPVVEQKMSIYDAEWNCKESCRLEDAEGRTAGDYIYLYPPGIPLVTPGEVITDRVIAVVDYWLSERLHVSGVQPNRMMRVVVD